MIKSAREKDLEAKAEGDHINTTTTTTTTKFNKAPSSSRQWSAFRNPRIVRVSRAFGGKDRHSKVCTVRGLRDRRIRLSVPTAIQLYDLQDRLGLSQPSKVVDWLIDATKDDIDKLPPLQMPPGNFSQFHPQTLVAHDLNSPQSSFPPFFNPTPTYAKEGIRINSNDGDHNQLMGKSKAWDIGGKLKEVERESCSMEKTKWMRGNEQENQDGRGGNYIPQVSAQNFFPLASNSNSNPNANSFPSLLNNSMPYNYFHSWDPNSNLSLSHQFPPQMEGSNMGNLMSIPTSMAFPSGSQLFLSPPLATPTIFPSYPPYIASVGESDTRQINHFPLLSSNLHHFPPNPLMSSLNNSFGSQMSVASKAHRPSQNDERQPNEGSTG